MLKVYRGNLPERKWTCGAVVVEFKNKNKSPPDRSRGCARAANDETLAVSVPPPPAVSIKRAARPAVNKASTRLQARSSLSI